tara:strand:- start:271 stop:471 length:201 start_codon:yes stop_codon:yes gene_type:complete
MKTILMILHLSNGEVAKLPVTILTAQTCNDKMIEMFKPKDSDDGIYFHGQKIWVTYCQTGSGDWVK